MSAGHSSEVVAVPKLPIGVSHFPELIREKYIFVDKTLFIRDFFNSSAKVTLITRSRRWGKTLILSMVESFLSREAHRQATQGLFAGLQIATVDEGAFVEQHQGQYPVIFISLKDVKADNYDHSIESFRLVISVLFGQHTYLETHLNDSDKLKFQRFLTGTFNHSELENSLRYLSELLFQHTGKQVYILLDEYDTPLSMAHRQGYLEPLSIFMRNFFSSTFKDNQALAKGLMTGILRISQSEMLSGLNNLATYTLLDRQYSASYGFTEDEVVQLTQKCGLDTEKLTTIRRWYNGYEMGGRVIYNPWSIVNCLDRDGECRPYWVNTGDTTFIEDLLIKTDQTVKEELMKLMQGGSIEGEIKVNIRYQELIESPTALWTLLLFAGYLSATEVISEGLHYRCQLRIPNDEVNAIYDETFSQWLGKKIHRYDHFLRHLVSGEVKAFTESLGQYLLDVTSIHDFGRYPEAFYHGLMLGLISSLRRTHHVRSNRESGRGRYDIAIFPRADSGLSLGIILEFKQEKETTNLSRLAEEALEQIETNAYLTELGDHDHLTEILQVGLAFSGKEVCSAHCRVDAKTYARLSPITQEQPIHSEKESSSDGEDRKSADQEGEKKDVRRSKRSRKDGSTSSGLFPSKKRRDDDDENANSDSMKLT